MLTKSTEWEGEHVRLVRLGGLPGKGYGRRRRGTPVDLVYVHQSNGSAREGTDAALALAEFDTSPMRHRLNPDGSPVHHDGRPLRTGGGLGLPGCRHTFVVPCYPAVVEGKAEVYRMNDDDRHTPHTGPYYDRVGVSVCFAGDFVSRYVRKAERQRVEPEPLAMLGGCELILDYLCPRYGIDPAVGLKAHYPGDALERWVTERQGGHPLSNPNPAASDRAVYVRPDARTFDTYSERQQALLALGHELGRDGVTGVWCEASKGALLAFQDTAGITVDGRWGNQTESAARAALEAHAAGEWPTQDRP